MSLPVLDRRLLLIGALTLATAPAAAQTTAPSADRRPRQGGRLAARRGAAASNIPPARSLSYGTDPLQSVDLYADPGSGPILMFVHGGGWSRGDRRMVNALPDYATRHGLILASAGYRLAPAVTAREAAMDVAAAVGALRRALPGRPIFLVGHSAGAHLAALVGVDPAYLGAVGMKPSDLGGVILLDGAGYDATGPRGPGVVGRALDAMYDQAFGPEGGSERAALSPTLRVEAGRAYPPFLIFHVAGRQDAAAQSRALAAALTGAGGRAEVVSAPGETHMTINRDFGRADDPEGDRAAGFIAMNAGAASR
ncbi:MAG: alpha/beta hydrolase [Brevundimonas sp.]|uniref:alpha/beta hydrolase n=1 Tax=Brevundimonas sp. TaxID=1871086 RepID=UPI0040345E28